MTKKLDIKQIGKGLSNQAKKQIGSVKEKATVAKYTFEAAVDTIVDSIDQNGDGKFDFDDIAVLRRQRLEKKRQTKLKRDLNALNPVFEKTLSDDDFLVPDMVRISEMDKQHASNSMCTGSIGHETLVKDLRIVTVYPDQIEKWGLYFYPDTNQELYYVNPINPNLYIGVNEYFKYLKDERFTELEKIAQDLGATYFRVDITEQKKSKLKKDADIKLTAKQSKQTEKISNKYSKSVDESSEDDSFAELYFRGHLPEEPQLFYFRNEPQIKKLIEMRMNTKNELTEQHIRIKCSRSSGIKEKEALSIDAALNSLKLSNTTSFANEAHNEVRQTFEYVIRF